MRCFDVSNVCHSARRCKHFRKKYLLAMRCHPAYHVHMDKHQARAALQRITNLTHFAKRSKLPIRTLFRLRAGEGEPRIATLVVLAADLKRIKPEMEDEHELC